MTVNFLEKLVAFVPFASRTFSTVYKTFDVLHDRLGHLSFSRLHFLNNYVPEIKLIVLSIVKFVLLQNKRSFILLSVPQFPLPSFSLFIVIYGGLSPFPLHNIC